eukprot:scaffold97192_cov26-Tisochrysis_lutea.AAC.4
MRPSASNTTFAMKSRHVSSTVHGKLKSHHTPCKSCGSRGRGGEQVSRGQRGEGLDDLSDRAGRRAGATGASLFALPTPCPVRDSARLPAHLGVVCLIRSPVVEPALPKAPA